MSSKCKLGSDTTYFSIKFIPLIRCDIAQPSDIWHWYDIYCIPMFVSSRSFHNNTHFDTFDDFFFVSQFASTSRLPDIWPMYDSLDRCDI